MTTKIFSFLAAIFFVFCISTISILVFKMYCGVWYVFFFADNKMQNYSVTFKKNISQLSFFFWS